MKFSFEKIKEYASVLMIITPVVGWSIWTVTVNRDVNRKPLSLYKEFMQQEIQQHFSTLQLHDYDSHSNPGMITGISFTLTGEQFDGQFDELRKNLLKSNWKEINSDSSYSFCKQQVVLSIKQPGYILNGKKINRWIFDYEYRRSARNIC